MNIATGLKLHFLTNFKSKLLRQEISKGVNFISGIYTDARCQ